MHLDCWVLQINVPKQLNGCTQVQHFIDCLELWGKGLPPQGFIFQKVGSSFEWRESRQFAYKFAFMQFNSVFTVKEYSAKIKKKEVLFLLLIFRICPSFYNSGLLQKFWRVGSDMRGLPPFPCQSPYRGAQAQMEDTSTISNSMEPSHFMFLCDLTTLYKR
jgi:hypothetical protein